MGISLDKVVATYQIGNAQYVNTMDMATKLRAVIATEPTSDLCFEVFGAPGKFWKKSSPFSKITEVNYYALVDMPGVMEIVCESDRATTRRKNKWSRHAAQILGLPIERCVLSIKEV